MAGIIAKLYDNLHNDRRAILNRVRQCTALTKPWLLPPEGQSPNNELPDSYASVPTRALTAMEGKLLLSLFPPDRPFFRQVVASKVKPLLTDEELQAAEAEMYLRELAGVSILESAGVRRERGRSRSGFRVSKRKAIQQILATGDSLERMTDDYRIHVYRRDQYVTRRDEVGDPVLHGTKELIDPLSLDRETIELANLDYEKLSDKRPHEREEELYTLVEWHPESELWVIEQEINGVIVNTSEEPESPFFATAFELAPGEHYGRGIIELNLGDIRSIDTLALRELEFAAIASKHTPVIDEGSSVRPSDLMKMSGEPIIGRVAGGQVQDVGYLSVNKLGDFQVVRAKADQLRRDIAQAMLLESDAQPRGERVTATQIQRIAMEMDGALGGLYAPIAEQQQLPMVRRLLWQMERDGIISPLPADQAAETEISILTGVKALARELEGQKLMTALQALAQLGPEATSRIDINVATDIALRASGADPRPLVKSDERIEAERRAENAAAAESAAANKAIDVVGNIAQETAIAAATGGPNG